MLKVQWSHFLFTILSHIQHYLGVILLHLDLLMYQTFSSVKEFHVAKTFSQQKMRFHALMKYSQLFLYLSFCHKNGIIFYSNAPGGICVNLVILNSFYSTQVRNTNRFIWRLWYTILGYNFPVFLDHRKAKSKSKRSANLSFWGPVLGQSMIFCHFLFILVLGKFRDISYPG